MLTIACASEPDETATTTTATATTTTPTTPEPEPEQQELAWAPCTDENRFDCARLRVHLDPLDDDSPIITLAVMRRRAPAASRVGVVFFDRGGPLESLSVFPNLWRTMPQRLVDHFDVVTFDRRGVGKSEPQLFCKDLDDMLGRLRVRSAGEYARDVEAVVDAARACDVDSGGGVVGALGSVRSARDVDILRQALGEEQLVFYGTSYGTLTGTTYATLFPERVRALVLDAVVALTPTFRDLEDAELASRTKGGGASSIKPWMHRQAMRAMEGLHAMNATCDRDAACPAGPETGKRSGRIETAVRAGDFEGVDIADYRRCRDAAVDRGPQAQREWFRILALEHDVDAFRAALTTFQQRWLPEKDKEKATATDSFFRLVHCIDGLDEELTLEEIEDELAEKAAKNKKGSAKIPVCAALAPVVDVELSGFSVVTPPNVSALVFTPRNDGRTPAANARLAATAFGAPLVTWEGVGHGATFKSICAQEHLERFIVDGVRPDGDVSCR